MESGFRDVRNEEHQEETSSYIKEVLRKLNEKVNKLYSWQIAEIELVAKLTEEIQTLKRSASRAHGTSASHRSSRDDCSMSTKLGEILLRSLSESLNTIAVETNEVLEEDRLNEVKLENARFSKFPEDNVGVVKCQLPDLSKYQKSTEQLKGKTHIIKSHKIEEYSQMGERPELVSQVSNEPCYAQETHERSLEKRDDHHMEANVNNRLVPQILEEVGNLLLKPVQQEITDQQENKNIPIIVLCPQPIPMEVSSWIRDLKDEIVTGRMTLEHMLQVNDVNGASSQQFSDFVHMIKTSEMIQPSPLPDVCANWLPNATGAQVGVIRELTNILQSVKTSIKCLTEESNPDLVRKRHTVILKSRILVKPLPTFNANVG